MIRKHKFQTQIFFVGIAILVSLALLSTGRLAEALAPTDQLVAPADSNPAQPSAVADNPRQLNLNQLLGTTIFVLYGPSIDVAHSPSTMNATIVCDDGDACFSYHGTWNPPSNPNQYCKYDNDMRFGYACFASGDCQPNNDNYSVFWRPDQVAGFASGNYEAFAYISRCDSATPHTQSAKYYLRQAGDSAASAPLMKTVNQAHPYQDNTSCADSDRWVSLGTYNFTSGTYVELRAWTDESATQWGAPHHVIFADAVKFVPVISADTTPPDGAIISPASGTIIGPSSVSFTANAWDNTGGSGVNRVEFYVAYDGSWHLAGIDSGVPYGINWSTPSGLGTQQLTFTIHVIDNAGNRKMDPGGYRYVQYTAPPLSIGFVVNRDGYSFPNYGGVNHNDYTIADMRRAFGDSAVCHVVILGWCWVRSVAQEWNDYVNEAVDGGHCYGMAVTSFRFFKGVDNPSSFQSGASTPYQMRLDSARRNIAYYAVEQFFSPAKDAIAQSLRNPPTTILNQLRANLSNGAPDPAILAVLGPEGGHAVTPYAIEDRGGGVYWIKVYDNNHPNDTSRHVIVNTAANTWSYDLGGLVWTGTASSHSMAIVPMTKNPEHPVCPWCNSALNASNLISSPVYAQVFVSGQGRLLVTDSIGRRIGFIGDQFVNEIPDAYESPFIGGLGLYREPAYNLPLTLTYSLLIDGSLVTGTNPASLYQFGPGYAASIKDIEVTTTTQSLAEFAPDGTYLSFSPSTAQEVTLSLSHEVSQASYLFRTEKFSIDAEQTITLTNELSDGKLKITSSKVVSDPQFSSTSSWASSSGYDVEVVRTDAGGQRVFVHSGIGISPTDTHYLDYEAWDGYGSITVTVDSGSDGIVDQVLSLENQQPQKIYLPLVVNKYVAVTADFTATPVLGTVPLAVTFANTSLGAYTSSLWNFGDGQTGTSIGPTHVYTQTGSYTITLTVSNTTETSTLTRPNYITVADVPVNFAATPLSGMAPLSITFTNLTTGTLMSSLWDFGDNTGSTQHNPIHVYTMPGLYTVTLTVSTTQGQGQLIRPAYISVNAAANVLINGGFEVNEAWQFNNPPSIGDYTTAQAHTGARSAKLGVLPTESLQYGYAAMTQLITVPVGAANLKLSFWYWPRYEGGSASLADNRQSVKILDANHSVVQEVMATSDDSTSWQFRSFDLTGYAGQTIYLEFSVFNDGNFRHKRAAMYVDDVSLTMIPATAGANAQHDYPH